MSPSAHPTSRFVLLLILIVALPLTAQSRGGQRSRSGPGTGNPEEQPPPWRFVEKGAPPVTTPLTLYWLPLSNAEMDRSPLLSSRILYDGSRRCVALGSSNFIQSRTRFPCGQPGNEETAPRHGQGMSKALTVTCINIYVIA